MNVCNTQNSFLLPADFQLSGSQHCELLDEKYEYEQYEVRIVS